MKTLRHLLGFTSRLTNDRFESYYTHVARSGAGFPTADEARKDLRNAQPRFYGWTR